MTAAQQRGLSSISTYRMTDWITAGRRSLGIALIGYLIVVLLSEPSREGASIFAAILFACLVLATLVVEIRGFEFDLTENMLSYPVYMLRLSIPLSEIQDANCQTTRRLITPQLFNDGSVKQKVPITTHSLNLSGEFGARKIYFGAKYKRDQFLSILREVAPECRITRWS